MSIQEELDLPPSALPESALIQFSGPCALEDDAFPFEAISDVAEIESWRKELNRPIYHIHKWWAKRLGTVFRAITLAALTPSGSDVRDLFYRPVRLKDFTIFDPFMGSGTTIGEAVKLGARAIGRDINPVAYFLVRNALAHHDREAVLRAFREIEADTASEIKRFYKAELPDGTEADVLYFFWVKQVDCPACAAGVDLFSTRIFAKHANRKRYPTAQAACPGCGEINATRFDAKQLACAACDLEFDPQTGPANGQQACCPSCEHEFPIAKTVRQQSRPPSHRLYAKLVLLPDGKKAYARATESDQNRFDEAARLLAARDNPYPVVPIEPGYNTNQVLGYNYRYWHEMFNERQLLCLSILADRIRQIDDHVLRDLFTCLFSGALEFNNIFASYKGEGTGAVRHMFAHHILQPARVPLEANVWGTPKSSGSFMTLFEGRIKRALDYADDPFEIQLTTCNGKNTTEKVYGLSEKVGLSITDNIEAFETGKHVYLSCGDSGQTDLKDKSVNAIITDPPFFDNVHYSQLADFFHVWQRHILGENGHHEKNTTRSEQEVQNSDEAVFTQRLGSVWKESHRVLRDDGILVFTYHHSRPEGWSSVLHALMEAGFAITAAHPIKAEMSVAMPKHQAKEPIDLDIIVVCRKRSTLEQPCWNGDLWGSVALIASHQVSRLRDTGRQLSRNDVRIIVVAQLLRRLSISHDQDTALTILEASGPDVEAIIEELHCDQMKQDKKG